MAFTRRETALGFIADTRSFAHHVYLAHCLWDWPENGGRAGCNLDLREHCDAVMAQLVGIGDELSRFLTLPTTSRSRHRMTKQGRDEAAKTIKVAYRLLDSMVTQRMTRLSMYAERLKAVGLSAGEVSRIRQYERFIEDGIERLRMIKMYRTPQALRSFARIFTFLLPPFYAPNFAQVAIDCHSLGTGIAYGIITAIGLTALFESLQLLEDPFVAYLTLDGIDVREEFEVLLWSSLVQTRNLIFPDAPPYPVNRRAALTASDSRQLSMSDHTFHHPRRSRVLVSDVVSAARLASSEQSSMTIRTPTNHTIHPHHHNDGDGSSSSSSSNREGSSSGEVETTMDDSYPEDRKSAKEEFGIPLKDGELMGIDKSDRESNLLDDGKGRHHRPKSASSSNFVGFWTSE